MNLPLKAILSVLDLALPSRLPMHPTFPLTEETARKQLRKQQRKNNKQKQGKRKNNKNKKEKTRTKTKNRKKQLMKQPEKG
ncbi:MAG: hypothetical protein ACKPFE_01330 [Dolichospermum sp.]